MNYRWKSVRTGLMQPSSKQVLELNDRLKLEVIQTQFRTETTDRAFSARLLHITDNGMQECIWHQEDIKENLPSCAATTALTNLLAYYQTQIDALTPVRDMLADALRETESEE